MTGISEHTACPSWTCSQAPVESSVLHRSDRHFFFMMDRLFTVINHLDTALKPKRTSNYFLSAAGSNNLGLWCNRKNFIWITGSRNSIATRCHSLTETADPLPLVPSVPQLLLRFQFLWKELILLTQFFNGLANCTSWYSCYIFLSRGLLQSCHQWTLTRAPERLDFSSWNQKKRRPDTSVLQIRDRKLLSRELVAEHSSYSLSPFQGQQSTLWPNLYP
jgi:hypothetical protein